mgnify:CR=1 FL=1
MQEKLKAYQELYAVAAKHEEHLLYGTFNTIKDELEQIEKSVEFGVTLEKHGTYHYHVKGGYDNWTRVLFVPKSKDHFIGCSDDGKQPQDEWLYIMQFTCGAYIFGDYFNDCYPVETFQQFFTELKGFEPKYCDSANSALYFTADKAKAVHEAFWPLFNKYKALVKEEMERKRIKELEQELAKLREKSV